MQQPRKTLRLLHLSDLHFGHEHKYAYDDGNAAVTLVNAVASALQSVAPIVDGIILSGDFFSKTPGQDLPLANAGLAALLQKLNLGPHQTICVPGNHDCDWNQTQKKYEFGLYDSLCGTQHIPYTSKDLPAVVPWPRNGEAILFILLNSCIPEQTLHGVGLVGAQQMATVTTQLANLKEHLRSLPRVAVLHHHLLPINNEEFDLSDTGGARRKSARVNLPSITLDAPELLRKLADWGVSVVLHGHRHEAAVLRYQDLWNTVMIKKSNPEEESERELFIFAAGTVGANDQEGRQFFLYELEGDRLIAQSFETTHGGTSFTQSEKALSIPIHRPNHLAASCAKDLRIIPSPNVVSTAETDTSDLVYLLLNVKDCDQAQAAIRSYFQGQHSVRYSDAWKRSQPAYVRMDSMYSVMGRWDVLVKLRLDPHCTTLNSFIAEITERLAGSKAIDNDQRTTSRRRNKDILAPRFCIETIVKLTREFPVAAHSVRLRDDKEYRRNRCQRAFFFIQVAEDRLDEMVEDLEKMLGNPETPRRIIEQYGVANKYLVLEVFMRCSESVEINQLNRALEQWVPRYTQYGAQKHTLLCFYHDENSISVDRNNTAVKLGRQE